jgi:hypothetical protein
MAGQNNTLKIVGITCGVIVALGVCGVGACLAMGGAAVWGATDAPAKAAHAFFRDLRTGNHQSALSRMSAHYQSTHDVATFQLNVSTIPALTQQTDSTFASRNITPGSANLTGSLTTASGEAPVVVILSQVGEHWYIDSVTVQGTVLQ